MVINNIILIIQNLKVLKYALFYYAKISLNMRYNMLLIHEQMKKLQKFYL